MCQGFNRFSGFLHHFVLAKLANSSIKVKNKVTKTRSNFQCLFSYSNNKPGLIKKVYIKSFSSWLVTGEPLKCLLLCNTTELLQFHGQTYIWPFITCSAVFSTSRCWLVNRCQISSRTHYIDFYHLLCCNSQCWLVKRHQTCERSQYMYIDSISIVWI